jgi:ribosomal protein S6
MTDQQYVGFYEILYVMHPEMDEAAQQELREKVQNVVKSVGGEIQSEDCWGKRRLAYEVKKLTEGIYVCLLYRDMSGKSPAALESMIRVETRIIRHLITIVPKEKFKQDELNAAKRAAEEAERAAAEARSLAAAEARAARAEAKAAAEAAAAAEAEAASAAAAAEAPAEEAAEVEAAPAEAAPEEAKVEVEAPAVATEETVEAVPEAEATEAAPAEAPATEEAAPAEAPAPVDEDKQ